jgi:NTP pyrophosphatase (non-canonical NTP hydrolase)
MKMEMPPRVAAILHKGEIGMTRTEHLLTILAEECAEVAHRASKALRFGLDDVQEGQDLTNAERIREELDDLSAIITMLGEEGALNAMPNTLAIHRKCQKVRRYLEYSRERGTLTGL